MDDGFPLLVAREWRPWARPALQPYDGWRIIDWRGEPEPAGLRWVRGRPIVVLTLSDGDQTARVQVDYGRRLATVLTPQEQTQGTQG
jgi:hypothetical protein